MSQADSKVLVLGVLAGMAGISLAVVWYRSYRSRRRGSWSPLYISHTSEEGTGLMLVDLPALQTGQAEVLQRLEALIRCVSELKEEMKMLKNTLPTLQELREEWRLHDEAHRASSHHRTTLTRKKRASGTLNGTSAEALSSEEAGSEGG